MQQVILSGVTRLSCSRSHRALALVLLAVLAGGPVAGQDYFEIVDVPLIDVDVVVTDRRDRLVGDLDREDFRLLIDGQEHEIAFFSAPPTPGEATEVAPEPTYLVVLFDNNGVATRERNRLIEELRRFVAEDVNPGLQMMVASAGLSGVEIHQELSSDPGLIDSALGEVAGTVTRDRHVADYESLMLEIQRLSGVRDPTQRQLRMRATTLVSQIQAFSDQARQEAEITGGQLWQLVEALAGLPGRKAILFVGGAMSISPGEALFSALREALTRTADTGAHQVAADLPAGISTGGSDAVEALSQAASVNQVALYSIVVGGSPQSASSGGSAGSLSTEDSSATDPSSTWAPGVDFRSRMEIQTALNALASATGGFVHSSGRNLQGAWNRLQGELEGSYSLGFYPAGGTDGELHRIEVEIEGKKLRPHHRRTFRAQGWDQESAARVRSALHFELLGNPLAVTLEVHPARISEEGTLRVPLKLEIPLPSVALEPIERSHRGQLSIFTVAGGARFQAAPARKTVLPLILPNSELQSSTSRIAEFRLDQEVPEGTQRIGVGVRDDLSSELSILIVDLPQEGALRVPVGGAVETGRQGRTLDEAILRLPTAALVMSGQNGGSIGLAIEGRLESGPEGLWRVPIETRVTSTGDVYPSELDLFAFALSDGGRVVTKTSQVVHVDALQPNVDDARVAGAVVPLELAAGRYMIRVAVRDREGTAFGVTGMEVEVPGSGVDRAHWSSSPPSIDPSEKLTVTPVQGTQEGDLKISRAVIGAGYKRALEALADNDEVSAKRALGAMESRVTDGKSRESVVELGKLEARVLIDMADGSWDRLLPLAVLYGEMIGDYRRSGQEPLSEHAVLMSTELAERMARKVKGSEAKAETSDLLVSLSGYLLYLQRLRKTQDLLDLALGENPHNPWALMAVGATLEQRGDYLGALDAFETLLEVAPVSGEGRLRLAVNLARTGKTEEAVESLRAVSEVQSEEWVQQVAAHELARALAATGEIESAVRVLEQAAAQWPEQPSLRIQLAWLVDRNGQPQQAGEWVSGLVPDGSRATDSARYRYLQWYAEGLDELRRDLMVKAVEKAADLSQDLAKSVEATAGR